MASNSTDGSTSSSGSTIASITLTSGIQDISALLPLLGTEQCERHIGSALTEGYLYVAATPMSIFGSLGMASAGFKTCLACISIPAWNIAGAQKLRDAGFEAKGANFALIAVDPDDKDRRYLVETRLTSLLRDLHRGGAQSHCAYLWSEVEYQDAWLDCFLVCFECTPIHSSECSWWQLLASICQMGISCH